ncbi:MAG: OFA family MFS transporter [Reinekea forsetii]|uniref:MFS transporter / oxalate:formate antiporter n=1 Tax=Reinekea forsetii TaxID=1336806 RepID=A0A2K8KMD6_9GAMM|nr:MULTISPECIES: OFA family MFS transporter [Reinekea]ATX76008.1 MFS transporter / oxalate:formate antiporter [Reinekea forsetii]MDO7643527.1 OFA family MFS transporter [Reinekea forsetii]MDO7674477.1 OFA family MFS transporter [Reinekea forsetii]
MKNRWLIAASAVGVHASIGSVYAFSVFKKPLGQLIDTATNNEIAMTFSLAIFFLGMAAAIMGHFVERHGPRKAGILAASFFGGGMLIAGLGAYIQNLYVIWLGYGVLGGIGLGIGYITPVSTLVKWFPDRRGLATGLAIMGFGFGAMIGAPVFNYIIETFTVAGGGIAYTWFIMGLVYLVVMFASASYLERPPQGWLPAGMQAAVDAGERTVTQDLSQLMANEAIKKAPFYGLWIMMFINISCGLGVIYSASPLAQETMGLTATQAATMVGLMSLFNGLGRIGWASFSDVIGRGNTYMAFFLIQIVAFILLPNLTSLVAFQIVVFTILSCYGGGFATLPAFIGDLFGTKELGAIHGYILTAWAFAGLAGPQINAYLHTVTGSYEATLYIFSGAFVVALGVSIAMILYIKRARAELNGQPSIA